MNAIIPLNVTAIRVNTNDNSNIVNGFKGRTAVFENLPYAKSSVKFNHASTGDKIYRSMEDNPSDQPLGTGIHLHWELPDYFRKGNQSKATGAIEFPHAPNRWLVARYFSLFNPATQQYGPPQTKLWVVESDYITNSLSGDQRPYVSVPLPSNPAYNQQPYLYMGRVVEYEHWDPNPANYPASYLPGQPDEAGNNTLYLTAMGFVGPSFSSFYPECCSVFGFWDNFSDLTNVNGVNVFNNITQNLAVKFKASYSVMGWIHESEKDPVVKLNDLITQQYNDRIKQYQQQNLPLKQTPIELLGQVFKDVTQGTYKWAFNGADISATFNADNTLKSLDVPVASLCAGIMQEVVWDMLQNPGATYFLKNPDQNNPYPPYTWTDKVEIAVGNTTTEALSALIKNDLAHNLGQVSSELLDNYEYLLDALQLGLLPGLENDPNELFNLDEALHSRGFSRLSGGLLWLIKGTPVQAGAETSANNLEVTLPLALAEQLSLLNQAQKNYDQGRAQLLGRRNQLFMDWFRYINLQERGSNDPLGPDGGNFFNQLKNFVYAEGNCELQSVISYEEKVGLLLYRYDATGQVTAPQEPLGDTSSLAYQVWQNFDALNQVVGKGQLANLELVSTAAANFLLPTDPVAILEGKRLEPVRRNGPSVINCRMSGECITDLKFAGGQWTVPGASLTGVPTLNRQQPMVADAQLLLQEAFVLIPMLAGVPAAALAAQGGDGNPAVGNLAGFITSLQTAQGGLSPLEGAVDTGLFQAIREDAYLPAANPTQQTTTPLTLMVEFTNAGNNGWAPVFVAWSTQTLLPKFTADRVDPFIPIFLIWTLRFEPLKWNNGQDYDAANLTEYFEMDEYAIDYQYLMPGGQSVPFTTGKPIQYENNVTLSKKATYSLSSQIDRYFDNYPNDPAIDKLRIAQKAYNKGRFLAQGLSGFNSEQVLRNFLPQIRVNNLAARPGLDQTTIQLKAAATHNPQDLWYNAGFNSEAPIAEGGMALGNFGPLRSGFMEIFGLEIVDVFGQPMQLRSQDLNTDKSLQVIPAFDMQPQTGDSANAVKIFLPPRINVPTRLWFRWLSANFDRSVSGFTSDFVEMNTHPATTPVCGWVVPNHLDNNLFFYDFDGSPIGSFGLEHGALKYRTRPGNPDNPGDLLYVDIGKKGVPKKNPQTAQFMWLVYDSTPDFLNNLMQTIESSDKFIHPGSFKQDAGLAVFIGRPLAITRAVVGLETSGNLLPLSQADTSPSDPWHQDVVNNRFDYPERQQYSSAQLGAVQFPLRLGDLVQLDDGLVGYLLEDQDGYVANTFYSPAAPENGVNKVVRPAYDNILLRLNDVPHTLTLLIDPRAAIHATTGVLPVAELQIPQDQYMQTMQALALSFFTHPVLQESSGLVVPLPQETGYKWSWVQLEGQTPTSTPLQAQAATDLAQYSYTPQTVLEGWLEMLVAPPPVKPINDKNDGQ